MYNILVFAVFILTTLTFSESAHADVHFSYQVNEFFPDGSQEEKIEKIWVKENRMKTLLSDGTAEIIDLNQERMWHINYPKKSFLATDLKEEMKQFEAIRQILRTQFAEGSLRDNEYASSLGPEDPTSEQSVRIEQTLNQEEIQGYLCKQTFISTPLRSVEAWVTTEISSSKEVESFVQLMAVTYQETPFLSEILGIESSLLEEHQFPVKLITRLKGAEGVVFTEEKQLLYVDTSPLTNEEFLPPADFSEEKVV